MPKLRKYNFNVPGGYRYKQPETGMEFDGNTPWKGQVQLILAHRKANNLARATYEEVWQDLEAFTCNRVPGVCVEGVTVMTGNPQITKKPCSTCGGRKR